MSSLLSSRLYLCGDQPVSLGVAISAPRPSERPKRGHDRREIPQIEAHLEGCLPRKSYQPFLTSLKCWRRHVTTKRGHSFFNFAATASVASRWSLPKSSTLVDFATWLKGFNSKIFSFSARTSVKMEKTSGLVKHELNLNAEKASS